MIPVTKIFRNESGAELLIFNRRIANGDSYNVPTIYWADGYSSTELQALIASGDVVVNDGISDLSISDALELLTRWQRDEASDIPFDNTSSMLDNSPTNVQEALEQITLESKEFAGWYNINSGQVLTVPVNRQMRINGSITLTGILLINGNVVID
jgi:hypothetical protein